jgi:chorismate mutase / prephenate dehydratase
MNQDVTGDVDVRLQRLRSELDAIDLRIVEALADRLRVIGVVSAFKETQPAQLRDRQREDALLQRLQAHARELRLDPHFVSRMFKEILEYSVRRQEDHLLARDRRADQPIIVGYQGTDGAWGHIAAQRHFGIRDQDVEYQAFDSFRELLEGVRSGAVKYGLLPIENTTAGSINEAYDLLARMDLALVGEEVQKVDHCLMALDDVPLDRIKRILSHPQAIAQCANFLAGMPHTHVESFANTALAARKVREDKDLSQAAIGSEEAARHWGLTVIARQITDHRENYTRFVVVAERPVVPDRRIACKTSLILTTKHKQGALVASLNVLADHGLNLTKLESRPRPGSPWEYVFYVDFEGNIQDENVERALQELTSHVIYLKVLGCYPSRTRTPENPAGA